MTPKIIEYQTLFRDGSAKLDQIVNEFIREGWQPFGGVAVLSDSDVSSGGPDSDNVRTEISYGFMQAMVKYEEPAPPPSFHETLLRSFERDLAEGRVAREYKEAVRAFTEQRRPPKL